MQLFGIRGENYETKIGFQLWVPMVVEKRNPPKKTHIFCLVCFGFLDAWWILCTSEFLKDSKEDVFSYGHTKCNRDLLVGSATAHPQEQLGKEAFGGSLSLHTNARKRWLKIMGNGHHLPKHQRGRTCLFRSKTAMKTGRDWLKISEGFPWLLYVSNREIHAKQLLAISWIYKKTTSHPMNSSLL